MVKLAVAIREHHLNDSASPGFDSRPMHAFIIILQGDHLFLPCTVLLPYQVQVHVRNDVKQGGFVLFVVIIQIELQLGFEVLVDRYTR